MTDVILDTDSSRLRAGKEEAVAIFKSGCTLGDFSTSVPPLAHDHVRVIAASATAVIVALTGLIAALVTFVEKVRSCCLVMFTMYLCRCIAAKKVRSETENVELGEMERRESGNESDEQYFDCE